jgi:hypothetical protein
MSNFKGRARTSGLLVLALGAAALLALSGLASAKDGHHGRHHRHGADTGTVAAFDAPSGVLSIELTGGDTVSGLVTARTEIRCEDEHAPDVSARSRGSEPGDDHGGHGEEAGDDNGGHGAEPGDDNGGHGVEPGDDSGGDSSGPSQSGPSGHDDNGAGANCTESDLVVGAIVHEAELDLRNGKAVFDEVELNG